VKGVIKMKFYICKHCGNIIEFDKYIQPNLVCCGEVIHELIPGSVDAAKEKHIPSVSVNGNVVEVVVGEIIHPMIDAHYIEWIVLETNFGSHKRVLSSGQEPKAVFNLAENEVAVSVYEYCNLHGLWVKHL
jgi:superoxide reductase